eukprot:Em0024g294a
MMAHWKERDHWLSNEVLFARNEIWDGERFKELSWFWNPEARWVIPALCPNCKQVVGSQSIKDELGLSPETHIEEHYECSISIQCPNCYLRFEHKPNVTSGGPRNIALIGHWDGWQPFSTSCKHSCGAIEVSIATMKKSDRCSTEEVYVSGFVPSYLLPNKCPISLDPFLEILVKELEDLFVNGMEVEYTGSSEGLPPGKIVIRCILLLWTGDYPAQAQVGKFIQGGIRPCRRCNVVGAQGSESTHYYYGNYRYHSRYPSDERDLNMFVQTMKDIECEDRPTVQCYYGTREWFHWSLHTTPTLCCLWVQYFKGSHF